MDQGLDLRFYIGVLRRRLLVMTLAFTAVAGAAVAVAVVLPPIFESQARIIIEAQQIPSDLVRSTVTGRADQRLRVLQQRITTREVLLGIVEKYKLFADENLTPTEQVALMRDSITIRRSELGSRRARGDALIIGLTVGFQHKSPEVASRVASELVTLILAEDVKSRTSRASETTHFIEREVERRSRELVALEAEISAFKLENDEVLPNKLPALLTRLDRANSAIARLENEIYASEEQERMMELELGVRTANLNPGGSGLSAAERQLQALNDELVKKRSTYTDTHPDIQTLRRQITAVQGQVNVQAASTTMDDAEPSAEDIARLDLNTVLLREKIEAGQRRRARLQRQRENVSRVVDELEQVIAKVPEVQLYLTNLERQQDAVRSNLAELNSKLNEARLGERLEQDKQAERFEVIEHPVTPTEPVKPNRPKILMGGLGMAGAAAVGIALLLEMLNRTVRSTADIARVLGQPPLAAIPYIVTTGDIRRNRARIFLYLLLFVVIIAAALAAVHFAYMPLDEVAFRVLRRFGL